MKFNDQLTNPFDKTVELGRKYEAINSERLHDLFSGLFKQQQSELNKIQKEVDEAVKLIEELQTENTPVVKPTEVTKPIGDKNSSLSGNKSDKENHDYYEEVRQKFKNKLLKGLFKSIHDLSKLEKPEGSNKEEKLTDFQKNQIKNNIEVADSIVNSKYDRDIKNAEDNVVRLQKELTQTTMEESAQKDSQPFNLTNLYLAGLGNPNKQSPTIRQQLALAEQYLQELRRSKKSDQRQLVDYLNPKQFSASFLSTYLHSLDSYKKVKSDFEAAKSKFKNETDKWLFGHFFNNDLYKAGVSYEQSEIKLKHYEDVKGKFETWCLEHNRLPKSFDELPLEWRDDIAKILNTDKDKNGNPVIFNQEFRKLYVLASVFQKLQIRQLGQDIFDEIQKDKKDPIAEKYLDQLEENIELHYKSARLKNLKFRNEKYEKDFKGTIDDEIRGINRNAHDPSFLETDGYDDPEYLKAKREYDTALSKISDIRKRILVDKFLRNIEKYTGTSEDSTFGKYGPGIVLEVPAKFIVGAVSDGFDLVNSLMGINNVKNSYIAKDPINKFHSTIDDAHPNGDLTKLNSTERAVVETYALENAYRSVYDKDDSDLMRWIHIANNSMLFVAEFLATGGVKSALTFSTKNVAKASAKALEKKTMLLLAKNGIEKLSAKTLNALTKGANSVANSKIVNSSAIKTLDRLVSDAGYSIVLTNTTGLPRTMNNAIKYETATPYGAFTTPNEFQLFGAVDPETDNGLWLAERRLFIEYFSEQMGEWGIGKLFDKAYKTGLRGFSKIPKIGEYAKALEGRSASKAINITAEKNAEKLILQLVDSPEIWKIGGKGALSKFKNFISNYRNGAFRQVLKNNGQWHGFLGEVSEEYYGIMLNHLFGSEEYSSGKNVPYMSGQWWKDMVQDMMDQSYDIWGGIALSTGYMSAFANLGSYREMSQYRKASAALDKVLGSKTAELFRKSLLFSKYEDMFSIMKGYLTNMDLTPENYKNTLNAVFDYYGRLMKLRGAVIGEDYIKSKMQSIESDFVTGAKETGYNLGTYVNIQNTKKAIDLIKTLLNEQYGIDHSILDDEDLTNLLLNDYLEIGNKDLVNRLYALQYLNNVVIGQSQRVTDDIFDVARNRANNIARLINQQTGLIHALLKNKEGEQNPSTMLFYKGGSKLAMETVTNRVITNGINQDELVWVSDANGLMKAIPVKDLDGYFRVDNPGTNYVHQTYVAARKNLADAQDEYLKQVGTRIGDTLTLANGDKITVLSSQAYKIPTVVDGKLSYENGEFSTNSGITYSVEHPDGTTEIKHDENIEDFREKVNESDNQEAYDITDIALQKADLLRLKREAYLYNKYRNNQTKQESEDTPTSDDYEPLPDFRVTVPEENPETEQPPVVQLPEPKQERQMTTDELLNNFLNKYKDTPSVNPDAAVDYFDWQNQQQSKQQLEEDEHTQALDNDSAKPEPVDEGPQFNGVIGKLVNNHLSAEKRKELEELKHLFHIKMNGQMNSGVNPEVILIGVKMAKYLLEAGINAFVDHFMFMLENMPKEDHVLIRKNIKSIYSYLRYQEDVDASKLTPDAAVAAFDVNSFHPELSEIEQPSEEVNSEELLKWDSSKETDEQRTAYNKIVQLIDQLRAKKIGVSSHHYFEKGQSDDDIIMASRVHDLIGPLKKDGLLIEYTDFYSKFLQLQISKLFNKSEFRSATRLTQISMLVLFITTDFLKGNEHGSIELADGTSREAPLKRFKDAFEQTFLSRFTSMDPNTQQKTKGGALELYAKVLLKDVSKLKEICDAIASSAAERDITQSVMSGNLFDDLGRICMPFDFDGNVQYENMTIGSDTNSYKLSDLVKIDDEMFPIMDKNMFEDCVRQLILCRNEYVRKGWKVITSPLYLSSEFTVSDAAGANVINVAGETDAIAIDTHGDIHIIDFKTYKYSLSGTKLYEDLDIEEFNNATKTIEVKHKTSTLFLIPNGFEKSTGVHYSQQQALYKLMLSILYKCPKSCELMMMGLHHRYSGSTALSFHEKQLEYIEDENWTDEEKRGAKLNFENNKKQYLQRIAIYKTFDDGTTGFGANRIRVDIDYANLDDTAKDAIRKIESGYVHFSDAKQQQYGALIKSAEIIVASDEVEALSEDILNQIDNINGQCAQLIEKLKTLPNATDGVITSFILECSSLIHNSEAVKKLKDIAVSEFVAELLRISNYKSRLNQLFSQYDLKLMWKYLDDVRYDLQDIYSDLIYFNADIILQLDQSSPEIRNVLDLIAEGESLLKWYIDNNGDLKLVEKNIAFFLNLVNDISNKILNPIGVKYLDLILDDSMLDRLNSIDDNVTNEELFVSSFLQFGLIEMPTLKHDKAMSNSVLNDDSKLSLQKAAEDAEFTSKYRFFITKDLQNNRFIMQIYTKDMSHQFSDVEINIPHKVEIIEQEDGTKKYKQHGDTTEGSALRKSLEQSLKSTNRIEISGDSIIRTNGRIRKLGGNVAEKYITRQNEFSANQEYVCMTSRVNVGGIRTIVASVPDSNGDKNHIYKYNMKNPNTNPSSGTVVFMHKESWQKDFTPINLMQPKFGDNKDVLNTIISILNGEHSVTQSPNIATHLGQQFAITVKGKQIETPLTNLQVLEMFINVQKANDVQKDQYVRLFIDDNNQVHVVGRILGVAGVDANGVVQVTDKICNNLEELRLYLATNVNIRINKDVLLGRFTFNNPNIPAKDMYLFMQENNLDKITLSGNLAFEKSDFDASNENGGICESGLHWYVKHGCLTCENFEFVNPLIGINSDFQINTTPQEQIIENPYEDVSFFGIGASLAQTINANEWTPTKVNQQKVKEDIDKMLGEVCPLKWFTATVDILENKVVLGKCYAYFLEIAENGVEGVHYHEIFHRVVELLLSEKERETVYNSYRKLYAKTHPNEHLTDRQIAEKIADQFIYFMQNDVKFPTWDWNLVKMFRNLKRWYKFFRSIGSYRLYNLNRAVSEGKFRNLTPTKEQVERFEKFAEDKFLPFESNGAKIDSIIDKHQFNVLKKSLLAIILSPDTQNIDFTGKHTENISVSIQTVCRSNQLVKWFNSPFIEPRAKKILIDTFGLVTDEKGLPQMRLAYDTITRTENNKKIEERVPVYLRDAYGNLIFNKKGEKIPKLEYIIEKDNKNWLKIQPLLEAEYKKFLLSTAETFEEYEDQVRQKEGNVAEQTDKDVIVVNEDDTEGLPDESSLNPMTVGDAIKNHIDSADMFAPIDKASQRVKFFFSAIPDIKKQVIEIVDQNGTHEEIIAIPRLNELGLPQLLDTKVAWGRALTKLNDIEDYKELYERINELAKSDYMFEVMKNRLQQIVNAAFEITDDGWISKRKKVFIEKKVSDGKGGETVKVEAFGESTYADEAESIYTLIFCAVKGVLIPKKIAKAYNKSDSNDELKKGATIIEDADYSWQTENIRQGWSSNLANGSTKYIKLNKEGLPIYLNGKSGVFESIKRGLIDVGDWLEGKQASLNIVYDKVLYNSITRKLEKVKARLNNADPHNRAHVQIIKEWFIQQLNDLGITVSIEDLDYQLRKIDIVSNGEIIHDDGFLSFREFYKLADVISTTSRTRGAFSEHVAILGQRLEKLSIKWSNNSGNFIKLIDIMSRAQYFREQEDGDMSVLTIAGKKLYMYTENNFITSRLAELLSSKYKTVLHQLSKDDYFLGSKQLAGQEIYEGSVVLKALQNNQTGTELKYIAMCGFKSDMDGSIGIEYDKQGQIEDVAMKYALLGRGWLIFPPLSDKVSYGAIQGFENLSADLIRCYGLKYYGKYLSKKRSDDDKSSIKQWFDSINKTLDGSTLYTHETYQDGTLHVHFSKETLKQFLEYAKREYESAKTQLEYYNSLKESGNEDRMIEYMHRHDKKKQRVKDKNGVYHDPIEGARMSLFCGCYHKSKYVDFNKTILSKEDLINAGYAENDPMIEQLVGTYADEAFNLALAEKYFFGEHIDERTQLRSIERLLSNQVEAELNELVSCGALVKVALDENTVNKFEFDTSVDKVKIDSRLLELINKLMHGNETITNDAIIGLVADMSIKYQISFHEISRMYFGNLASYSQEWNAEGYLKTQTVDLFKRLGGLASTGIDNAVGIGGISTNYLVTEIEDDFVASPELNQLIMDAGIRLNVGQACCRKLYEQEYGKLKFDDVVWSVLNTETKRFEYDGDLGQIDQAVVDKLAEIKSRVEAMDETLHRQLLGSNVYDEIIKQCLEKAESFGDAESNEVNVTDGATYISENMCENLLRQLGLFTGSIKEAFMYLKNLRLEEGKPIDPMTLTKIAKYYSKVYTSVIGMQKYTAYGQRAYEFTDSKGISHIINSTYYLKTAFAPLFDCICTGGLRLVYNKMKEGCPNPASNISIDEATGIPMNTVNVPIDMLVMHSSLKNGSEGPIKDFGISKFKKWMESTDPKDAEEYKKFRFTHTYTQRYKDVRRQFNTDPKEHDDMNFGTQALKVIMSILSPDQIFDHNGLQLTATQIRNGFMSAVKELTELGNLNFRLKFFNEDGSLNNKKFGETLTKNLSARDSNEDFIEAMSVDETTGKQTAPLAAMSGTNWVQSILVSLINKDIVDVVTPGSAFYQRSAWGVEGNAHRLFSDGHTLDYTLYAGNDFKSDNEEHSMDCVLSIDYFEHLFKNTDLQFASFEEKKAFLVKSGIISGWVESEDKESATHFIELTIVMRQKTDDKGNLVYDSNNKPVMINIQQNPLIGKVKPISEKPSDNSRITYVKWNNAKANIVGYRIPTQAVSSIHAMRCVDVLPVVRDTIILPKDITTITGADFDIDKFFLSMKNYKLPKKLTNEELAAQGLTHSQYRKMRKFEEINENFDSDNRKRVLQNRMLDYQLTILKSKDVARAQLLGSIDKDTRPLTDLAKRLNKNNKHIHAYDSSSFRVSEAAKLDFVIGKNGIPPFALNNNSHVLCMLYNVTFDMKTQNDVLDVLKLKRLDNSLDRNGHSISSWLSGLINAHVDCAKDPYIRTLGVNPYTYNLVNLLIRTGYGQETFYFTTLPIMRMFYNAYYQAMGVYGLDETRSPQSRVDELINKTLVLYIATHLHDLFANIQDNLYKLDIDANSRISNEQIYKSLFKYYQEKYGERGYYNIQHALMMNEDGVKILELIGIDSVHKDSWNLTIPVDGKNTVIELSEAEIQTIVALTNFELLVKGKELANLVHYTKIDTKKYGKTIEEQKHYMNVYRSLTNPETSAFDVDSVKRMCDLSFIHNKTVYATLALSDLLKFQLLLATDSFVDAINRTDLNNPGLRAKLNINRDSVNADVSINKMLSTWIKSLYFFGENGYCSKLDLVPKTLMFGINSIYYRLNVILNNIADQSNSEYAHLRASDGRPNNYLLRVLIQQAKDEKLMQTVVPTTNDSVSYWEDAWKQSYFIKNKDVLANSVKSDEIQDGWEMLLNDIEHPYIQQFAEDLIVYAFLTSGDNGGALDLFKYVPLSWRLGKTKNFMRYDANGNPSLKIHLSYVEYIRKQLELMNTPGYQIPLTDFDIDEMAAVMHWDNNIVPTMLKLKFDKDLNWYGSDSNYDTPLLIGAVNSFASNEEAPNYFKIANTNFQYKRGQLAWHMYHKVAVGRTIVNNVVKTYPIYGLMLLKGGKYSQGQKIYDMGIYSNLYPSNYEFNLSWGPLTNFGTLHRRQTDPGELLQELVYGKLSSNTAKINAIEKLNDQEYDDYFHRRILYLLIADVYLYEEQTNTNMHGLYDAATVSQERLNALDTKMSNSTNLHLESLTNARYMPCTLNDLTSYFGLNNPFGHMTSIMSKKLNYEFYMKRSENGEYKYPVMTISFKEQKGKGFLEIAANIDLSSTKRGTEHIRFLPSYTISLNTQNLNHYDPENIYAVNAMSDGDLLILQKEAIQNVPEGKTLSMSGLLTNQQIEFLEQLVENGDKTKGYVRIAGEADATNAEGESIKIPVYVKSKTKPSNGTIAPVLNLKPINTDDYLLQMKGIFDIASEISTNVIVPPSFVDSVVKLNDDLKKQIANGTFSENEELYKIQLARLKKEAEAYRDLCRIS